MTCSNEPSPQSQGYMAGSSGASSDAAYQISEHVMVRDVSDGAILLHLKDGVYFGLDPVGFEIWRLLSEGHSCNAVVELLLGEYDVGSEQLLDDVVKLVQELESRCLIQPRD